MQTSRYLAAVFSVAVALAGSHSASAAIMQSTWTSVVVRDEKFAPTLGTPFKLSLTYDTALGVTTRVDDPTEQFTTLSNGALSSALVAASLTFDDTTYDINVVKTLWSLSQGHQAGRPDQVMTVMEGANVTIDGVDYNLDFSFRALSAGDQISLDLDKPFALDFVGGGLLSLKGERSAERIAIGSSQRLPGTISTVRLDTPTAVPEPATWALMIGGFGLAGVTLRRRQAGVA